MVSLGVAVVLFAMIFKLMPQADVGWRDVWVGAAVTAVLFEIGKALIGLYIGKSSAFSATSAAWIWDRPMPDSMRSAETRPRC